MATATVQSDVPAAKSPFLAPAPDGRARFSREAYRRMYEAGFFGADAHVELVDGEIMMMSPIGPWHGELLRRLTWFFIKNLPDQVSCSAQLPIVAGDHSEPEPDIALVQRREDHYKSEHPGPSDVLLLIEVSESSLKVDTGRKLQFYASIGIPDYWVIDVAKQSIIDHRLPAGNSYQHVEVFKADSRISPASIPECQLDLNWLFR